MACALRSPCLDGEVAAVSRACSLLEAETHKDPSWQGPCFLAGSKKDRSPGTRESSQPRVLAVRTGGAER